MIKDHDAGLTKGQVKEVMRGVGLRMIEDGFAKEITDEGETEKEKEEKKKAQDEKEAKLKDLSSIHDKALEVVISSEEVVKVAEEGLKEHPEDKDLLKALEDGKVLLKEAQEKVTEAETALDNAKKGEDASWLKKLFGGK